MKLKKIFMAAAVAATALTACQSKSSSGDAEMDRYIDDLMGQMTLHEKIGQLNLPVTGDIVTGQAKSSNIAEKIKAGRVWRKSARCSAWQWRKAACTFRSSSVWM